ncbi:protein retinal degeneration B-like [Montipora foliosa]|uniref:protein retinal degeneration B-like n=1 Tax=Montipora foliosa TaxID=591990 RepID=UPI0035F160C8
MLIKEYRIPLPMSVEEYRIAQLYMIQKKSRLDSIGEGSGVEILENTPYTDGPGGSGQYTKKIYHIGSHLPGWLKAILPKAALRVEEEAWNAYPYTKMRTTCPFVEKFFVDVETFYLPDAGQQENVFNLSPSDLQGREVDVIDPVKDTVSSSDYCEEEDPLLYQSKKTGRGPIKEDWLEHYRVDKPPSDVMCAYKLIKVEFKYWGMQNKIEHFIHYGLRRPMLMGHRQAWVWQDEWYGLTIDDIRKLEEETQRILSRKMGGISDLVITGRSSHDCESEQEEGFANEGRGSVVYVQGNNNGAKIGPISNGLLEGIEGTVCTSPVAITVEKFGYDEEDKNQVLNDKRTIINAQCNGMSQKEVSLTSDGSANRRLAQADYLKGYRMSTIETADSESEDEEFFDAQEELEGGDLNSNLLSIHNVELGNSFKSLELDTDSSRGSRESLDSIASSVTDEQSLDKSPRLLRKEPLCQKFSDTSTCSLPTSRITSLILVIHGGTQVDASLDPTSRDVDFTLLQEAFEAVVNLHYRGAAGRIALRLVECPAICSKALTLLSQLCPYSESDSDKGSVSSGFTPVSSSFPLSAISLMVSSSPFYNEAVNSMVVTANMVYRDFLKSDEGQGFRGEVCLLGDCMGALLAYDALICSDNTLQNRLQSFNTAMLSPHSPTALNNTETNGSVAGKPRRISSHTPPIKSNLQNSQHLRLSVSSGNIRENVDPEMDEIIRCPPDRDLEPGVLHSPHPLSKAARLQTFSFENMSLSVDSVEQLLFDFEVSKFFAFGSPIGLVLAYRRFSNGEDRRVPPKPACNQVYNLFHPFDPSASRIEPLIIHQFSNIPAVNVPRYQRFPLGDGQSHLVNNVIGAYSELFVAQATNSRPQSRPGLLQRDSDLSTTSLGSCDGSDSPRGGTDSDAVANWWGTKRVDFALYCPEGLQQFPTAVLSPLFHVSYWESSDVAAFVVREILHGEWDIASVSSPSRRCQTFCPLEPREKWLKRRTAIKIKNLNANHRANDCITLEGQEQTLSARFMYGPLDMVSLSGEKVDVYVMTQPPSGEYVLFDTAVTGSGGRLSYSVPEDKKLPVGIYPFKLVVRGDHTWVDSNLAVLPPKTEAVVFSIDGSFTASVSIRGKDPKVRAGAVDVVRHWQELGFLIIYVTSRLDFQKIKVMSWLAEHNFPYGLVSFGSGISKDIQRHKTEFLRYLVNDCQVQIHAAYGSVKDISVYASIGVKPQQIYTVGKHHPRKYTSQAQFLKDGYAAHLTSLSNLSKSPVGNSRLILRRGCFGLPSRTGRTRHKMKRSISDKPSNDSDKESSTLSGSFNYSSFRHTKGRSMSKFDQEY